MLKFSRKRILSLILFCLGTLWIAPALVAQPLPQIPQNQVDSPPAPLTLTLTRTTPEKLEQALRQICDHRVAVESPYQYVFTVTQNNVVRQCRLRIEPQSNRVFLTGDKQLCEQVFRLITAIDLPPPRGVGRTIITYQPYVSPEILAQAFEAHRIPVQQPRTVLNLQSSQNTVIPAQAGIQTNDMNTVSLDPHLRGGDDFADRVAPSAMITKKEKPVYILLDVLWFCHIFPLFAPRFPLVRFC